MEKMNHNGSDLGSSRPWGNEGGALVGSCWTDRADEASEEDLNTFYRVDLRALQILSLTVLPEKRLQVRD